MESRQNKHNKKSRKKVLTFIVSIIALVLVTIGGYLFYLNSTLNKTVESIYEPLNRGDFSKLRDSKPGATDPFSILLLGLDAQDGERGRTDTIIVLTINPDENSTYMLSIPRDTRTEIVGRGIQDKINHAFAFGGVDMTIDTVENFLNIPIDYYGVVNMDGFVSIIDVVGGVTLDVGQSFNQDGFNFSPGMTEMDGEMALAYTRMRKQDPRGDLGRNDRQQEVIRALMKETASIDSFFKVDNILSEVQLYVRTNKERQDMDNLIRHYRGALSNQEKLDINGSGATINGVWFYVVDEQERLRISHTLREHLSIQ